MTPGDTMLTATAPMTGPTTATLRVAIVDDDRHIRTVLRLLLAASGRAVLVAEADGADTADTALAGAQPDVVLLGTTFVDRLAADLAAHRRAH